MGDSAPYADASELCQQFEGLSIDEQHALAYRWGEEHGCLVDMFGSFSSDRKLTLFVSGNESENWLDTSANLVYKMNTLMHVGDNLCALFKRVSLFNKIFPSTRLSFVGFNALSTRHVYPVFTQPFIDNSRFATEAEIQDFMSSMGYKAVRVSDGVYENKFYRITDVKPKNVLAAYNGAIFVIDADVVEIES